MTEEIPSMHPDKPLVPATPAQQKILNRIAAQRERNQDSRQTNAQANSAAEVGAAGIGDDSLVLR